jgi:hypothetical protein
MRATDCEEATIRGEPNWIESTQRNLLLLCARALSQVGVSVGLGRARCKHVPVASRTHACLR